MAQGSQGPRSYMFCAQRVRVTRPGHEAWAVYRRNLDGSEPRYYLSNAPEDTMLETLACVGGSRWPIETEFETEKGDVVSCGEHPFGQSRAIRARAGRLPPEPGRQRAPLDTWPTLLRTPCHARDCRVLRGRFQVASGH